MLDALGQEFTRFVKHKSLYKRLIDPRFKIVFLEQLADLQVLSQSFHFN